MSNGEKGLESRAPGLSAPFVSVQGSPGSLWLLICFPVDLDLGLRTGAPSGILGRIMLVVYGSSNSAHLRLLIFLLAILIPVCASSSICNLHIS